MLRKARELSQRMESRSPESNVLESRGKRRKPGPEWRGTQSAREKVRYKQTAQGGGAGQGRESYFLSLYLAACQVLYIYLG